MSVCRADFRVNENIPITCLFNADSDFSNFQCVMPLPAAAIGVIGTLGSSAINAASQARTNAVNKRMAEDAYSREQNAIREMNVYNSPSMQVARLKAAGLSPSMAYGANGEAVGNQSSIPAFNPIPAEAPRSGDLGAPFMDAARLGLETREQLNRDNLAIAELAVKDAQSFMMVTAGNLNTAQAEEVVELLGYKKQDYEFKWIMDEANYNKIQQDISESVSRVNLNEKQIEELDSLINLNDVKAHEILALLPHEIAQMDASAFMASAQAGLFQAEIGEVAEKVATLQYNRQLEHWDRQFQASKFAWEKNKWQKEMKIQIEQQHADRVTSIFRVIIGGAAIRRGLSPTMSNQRQPSPVITPSGGQMFGQNWTQ